MILTLCPDLITRYRVRYQARRLVGLPAWPNMDATSEQNAQLVLLLLPLLQRDVHRLVCGRHREDAAMAARSCVEALFLGLYCMRVPDAVRQLPARSLKALADGIAYLQEADIAPASVIAVRAAP